jgi:hypothetical protein
MLVKISSMCTCKVRVCLLFSRCGEVRNCCCSWRSADGLSPGILPDADRCGDEEAEAGVDAWILSARLILHLEMPLVGTDSCGSEQVEVVTMLPVRFFLRR